MNLQSLLVSKDEQAVAVLTPVLAGFGLGVQSCGYPDGICRLGEQKFDTVIVDYDDPHSAALVLQNAYQAASGNHAVTVALLSDKAKVRSVFGAGANFVLYKPVSEQHALATLRSSSANAAVHSASLFRFLYSSAFQAGRRWKAFFSI